MNNAIQLKAADAFASAHGYSASVVRLRNTSDVSIDYSVSGGDAVELAAGASAVVDVAALTSEISVRRTDLSTTPVNVMIEFGLDPDEAYVFAVENAPGGLTSHTHNYAGSSTPGGAATSAEACTGNAATATTAASCTGNSATATTASSCSGNAATATTLATARTLTIGGKANTFDGGADKTWTLAEIGAVEVYSTAETLTNQTFLGYPVYRKVINYGALPNDDTVGKPHGIPAPYTTKDVTGIASNGSDEFLLPHTSTHGLTYHMHLFVRKTDNTVVIGTGMDRSEFTKTYVTIEYIKADL